VMNRELNEKNSIKNMLRCHSCNEDAIALNTCPIPHQVSSDCRPVRGLSRIFSCTSCGLLQKEVNEEWLSQTSDIYESYAIYQQSGGIEQAIFSHATGGAARRSEKIVDWLVALGCLESSGSLLDIGCGNGAFLATFENKFRSWELSGFELTERYRSQVEEIKGVKAFYSGDAGSITEQFDVIALIHSLEHIVSPSDFLRNLVVPLLKPDGILLVDVPNVERSPFDLIIADHCSHFEKNSLLNLLALSGFDEVRLSGDCIEKELAAIFRIKNAKNFAFEKEKNIASARSKNDTALQHMDWLSSISNQLAAITGPIGIFGSSIAATWCASILREKAVFFVDEDVSRIGHKHLGIPIISIDDVPPGHPVLLAFRRTDCAAIKARLAVRGLNLIEL